MGATLATVDVSKDCISVTDIFLIHFVLKIANNNTEYFESI